MKPLTASYFAFVIFTSRIATQAQGSFQNLDFESANPVSSGSPDPTEVTFASAFPGWTGYVGSTETAVALYNNATIDDAGIDLFSPASSTFGGYVIQGQYTLALQPGLDPAGSGQAVSASISQTGLVPANAASLEFEAAFHSTLSITLGGQSLSISAWGTGPNYTLYAANIPPSEDGQLETLTITASGAFGINTFDAFAFSPTTIPEPSPIVLTGIGGLVFALYRRLRPRQE